MSCLNFELKLKSSMRWEIVCTFFVKVCSHKNKKANGKLLYENTQKTKKCQKS